MSSWQDILTALPDRMGWLWFALWGALALTAAAIMFVHLIKDEPFSALDVDLRQRLALEVSDLLRARGVAAVHVTHDPAEAEAIADHVLRFVDISE